MILIDTSAWIEFFRGKGECANSVDVLLSENQVALCGPVLTEITRGFRSERDKQDIIPLLEACRLLSQPENLWQDAGSLGFLLGKQKKRVKTLDLLIASIAIFHRVPILTNDTDFKRIQEIAPALALVSQ
ncbi:MAG: PIN domain-containing protein [Deltaproteobacteria bacterium]|nr:PIN domain-containing protein [Deltaproteobacteria bacterium]